MAKVERWKESGAM